MVVCGIALFLGLIFSSETKAVEGQQLWCRFEFVDSEDVTLHSVVISLGQYSSSSGMGWTCIDSSSSLELFHKSNFHLVGSSQALIDPGRDPMTYYRANTWQRPLTEEERNLYWCFLGQDISADGLLGAGDFFVSLMPSSPDSLRIPTIIERMTGEQTLASNLAIELYSAGWQMFVLLAIIKFYKLIPGKST